MSNATEIVTSWTDKTGSLEATDEMQSGSFVPSRLTLSIYHRLTSFAVYCMSTSATAVLIFLLLFWYYGGICLLIALLISVLGELELSNSYGHLAGILFVLMSFVFCLYYISSNTLILAKKHELVISKIIEIVLPLRILVVQCCLYGCQFDHYNSQLVMGISTVLLIYVYTTVFILMAI